MSSCKHTPCPAGFVEWYEWAEKKALTHDRLKCPSCGAWAVWRRRAATPDVQQPPEKEDA